MNDGYDSEYLRACGNKLKDISETNDMFHTTFKRFFDSLEESSLSGDIYVSLSEERIRQQSIYNKQNTLISDLEKEIQRQQRVVTEKSDKNEEGASEDGGHNSNKQHRN